MENNDDLPANAHVLCPTCKTLIPVAVPDVAAKDRKLSELVEALKIIRNRINGKIDSQGHSLYGVVRMIDNLVSKITK